MLGGNELRPDLRQERPERRAKLLTDLLVGKTAVGIEPFVRMADRDLGVDNAGACGCQHLAQLGLGPDAAVETGACSDHDDRLPPERTSPHGPRGPVDGILQLAGNGRVVLRRRDQERVGLDNPHAQGGGCERSLALVPGAWIARPPNYVSVGMSGVVNGTAYRGRIDNPSCGQFIVRRSENFDVSDATLLPSGDMLLLERKFSWLGGVGIRIRRIALKSFAPGAVVDGPPIFSADLGHEIDNMEGIDAHVTADGDTVITMISDDNFSMIQRNLLLQFTLVE